MHKHRDGILQPPLLVLFGRNTPATGDIVCVCLEHLAVGDFVEDGDVVVLHCQVIVRRLLNGDGEEEIRACRTPRGFGDCFPGGERAAVVLRRRGVLGRDVVPHRRDIGHSGHKGGEEGEESQGSPHLVAGLREDERVRIQKLWGIGAGFVLLRSRARWSIWSEFMMNGGDTE